MLVKKTCHLPCYVWKYLNKLSVLPVKFLIFVKYEFAANNLSLRTDRAAYIVTQNI